MRLASLLLALSVASSPMEVLAQAPPRLNGTSIYLLTQQSLPPELGGIEIQSCLGGSSTEPDRAAFLPLLLFIANLVIEEGLEALSRSEARRLESYSHTYGARVNLPVFPQVSGNPSGGSAPTNCVAVERRTEGALGSVFVFELRPMTGAAFTVRPILAHIAASPVTVRSRTNTINTTVLLGFSSVVGVDCRPDGTCRERNAVSLGTPSFTFRSLTVGQTVRQCGSATETGACRILEGPSALLPQPISPAPTTIATTVTEVSTRLVDARIQNAIWERQRKNLLAALNQVLEGALD